MKGRQVVLHGEKHWLNDSKIILSGSKINVEAKENGLTGKRDTCDTDHN